HDKEHIDPIYKSSKMCFKYFYSKRDRMRMKNYDYKAKMNRNRKRLAKQVAGVAIATTFTLSTPIVPNVIEDSSFKNVLSSSVVHAASDNIVDFGDESTQYINPYSTTSTYYSMGVHVEYPNYEDYDDIRVTWKIPEEMAAGFENQEYIDTMQRNAFISGSYLDENGDTVPSSEVHDIKYVSIDTSNHTIEYNLSQL